MKYLNSFVSIIIICMLVACQKISEEKMPGIDISLQETNKDITLSAPMEINTFTIGDGIQLILSNKSNNIIVFPQNYGVHIFTRQGNDWVPIDNGIEYPSGEKEIWPNQNQPFRDVVVFVQPNIDSKQPLTVRIFVIGRIKRENTVTQDQVGSYIDLTIQPK